MHGADVYRLQGQAPFLLNNMFTPTESATHTTIKPKSKNKLPSTCTPWTESLSTVSTTHGKAKTTDSINFIELNYFRMLFFYVCFENVNVFALRSNVACRMC